MTKVLDFGFKTKKTQNLISEFFCYTILRVLKFYNSRTFLSF